MAGLVALPTLVIAKNSTLLTRTPEVSPVLNSQTMPLLAGYLNPNPAGVGGQTFAIVDGSTLSAASEDSSAYIEGAHNNGQITTYVVRDGDTVGSIAQMFGVSINTILWANSLTSKNLKIGQELVILPISGVKHTVKSGDTIQSIAKKYKADAGDIISYNGLEAGATLAVGDEIIIPDGEISTSGGSVGVGVGSTQAVSIGYFLRPIRGGVKTQGLHGYNAVDLAAPIGTPIMASAEGIVVIARTSGYNGGYGLYVAIKHPNGTQTVYGHMSRVDVAIGQNVDQGQVIGAVGLTGHATGPHVHFEIRGARNPF